MTIKLDGKRVAAEVKANLAERVSTLKEHGIVPGLGTLLVGEDPGSMKYVAGKHADCAEVGIRSIRRDLPADASFDDIAAAVRDLNEDPACTGYIVQLPLPRGVDENAIIGLIDPSKDADGMHPYNLGELVLHVQGDITTPLPCTPRGVIELLDAYDIDLNGKEVCVLGRGITIGRTICAPEQVEPLPFVKINDPTVEMTFSVNDSPLAGREGKYVTSRQIRDRLQKELLKDVALKVEDSATTDSFRVMGRGEMHLSILIETMRREGYELQVSPPHVLTHEENGKTMEPMERVVIDVPETYQGNVMTALGARKAILMNMQMMNNRSRLEFRMPSRGLFGFRSQFLTDTHGEGIMNTIFDGYEEWCGPIATRSSGSLISFDTGDAVTYGLFNAQQRGTLIVTAGEKVYEGEVVGYTPTGEDITVNVCKTKHLTNTRASGSDDALRLIPVTKFSLEGCLEFLAPDELLEVTPENLRIRKRILDHDLRMKATSKKSKG